MSDEWFPNLSPKQADTLNKLKRFSLLHGPKGSSKTRLSLHAIAQRLWHYNNRFLVFSKTVKSAAIAGSWRELTEIVIPEWIDSGIGMEWAWKPKTDGSTRTHSFGIKNYHGGVSECFLFSVDHDQEVEAKVKNLVAGGIYFIELSNFKDRIVFDATISQLRLDSVPFDQQLWIADTNPDEDGVDSWIYKLWMEHNYWDDDVANELDPTYKAELEKLLSENLVEFLFVPEDNPFMDKRQFMMWEALYAKNPDLYARYIKGKWTKLPKRGAHFKGIFKREQHVIGKASGEPDNWEILMPSENCSELLTGWDLGDRWHSFHIVEKVPTEAGMVYFVLAELFNDGEQISIAEFTKEVCSMMDGYEAYNLKTNKKKVNWRHWSDSAANTNYKAAAGAMDANVVLAASGGRIKLLSSPKGSGSVKQRVDVTKTLLHDGRLLVSSHLFGTIEMFENVSKGKSQLHFVERNKYKHRFDSLTYILNAEEPVEVQNAIRPMVKKKGKLVSVG